MSEKELYEQNGLMLACICKADPEIYAVNRLPMKNFLAVIFIKGNRFKMKNNKGESLLSGIIVDNRLDLFTVAMNMLL